MQRLFHLTAEEIHDHVRFLRSVCEIVESLVGRPVVLSDPHDDPVLYTAIAGGANVLCSKDHHFFDPHVVGFCAAFDMEVMDEVGLLKRLGSR